MNINYNNIFEKLRKNDTEDEKKRKAAKAEAEKIRAYNIECFISLYVLYKYSAEIIKELKEKEKELQNIDTEEIEKYYKGLSEVAGFYNTFKDFTDLKRDTEGLKNEIELKYNIESNKEIEETYKEFKTKLEN